MTRQVCFCARWTGRIAHLFRTVPVVLTGAKHNCELMEYPAAVIYSMYTTIRHEIHHTRKGWPGPLVNPCLLSAASDSWGERKVYPMRRQKTHVLIHSFYDLRKLCRVTVLIYLQKFNQKNEEDETATIPTNEEGCITFLFMPRIFKSWAPGPSPLIQYLQRWPPDI